jgi:hypothetical protein
MPDVTVGEENSGSIDLYYEDHGSGPPVVVQGDSDQAVPFGQTGQLVLSFVKDAQLVTVSEGPHAIPWTHAEQVTTALLRFTGAPPLTETHKLGVAKGRWVPWTFPVSRSSGCSAGAGLADVAAAAQKSLPDPVDSKVLDHFCAKYGLSKDSLMDRMGGSP